MAWISKDDYKKLIIRLFKEQRIYHKLSTSAFAKEILGVLTKYGEYNLTIGPIDCAGRWYETVEGHTFWECMNDKFFMLAMQYGDNYHIDKAWLYEALKRYSCSYFITDTMKTEIKKALSRLQYKLH